MQYRHDRSSDLPFDRGGLDVQPDLGDARPEADQEQPGPDPGGDLRRGEQRDEHHADDGQRAPRAG
ncbi:hypothetical protein WDV91_14735 [Curtobacterium flaccumfaciens pv. flaccumfaciens]